MQAAGLVDPVEFATVKGMTVAVLDQRSAEERRKREQWLQETPAQAEAEMHGKLPAGFTEKHTKETAAQAADPSQAAY